MGKIEIDPTTLYLLLENGGTVDDYKLIEDTITSSDPEDGGASHTYVLQELSTNKFYRGEYSDWDILNTNYNEETESCDGRIDLTTTLFEVKPRKKTRISYE